MSVIFTELLGLACLGVFKLIFNVNVLNLGVSIALFLFLLFKKVIEDIVELNSVDIVVLVDVVLAYLV